MERSTKVILWLTIIVVIHVLLAVFGSVYYLLFEYIGILYLLGVVFSFLGKSINFVCIVLYFITIVASAPGLLWWLYRRVRQEVVMPSNALEVGFLAWLLGQCAISVIIAVAYVVPGQLTLVDKFLKPADALWWQVPLQLMASFPLGLVAFYFKEALYRRNT